MNHRHRRKHQKIAATVMRIAPQLSPALQRTIIHITIQVIIRLITEMRSTQLRVTATVTITINGNNSTVQIMEATDSGADTIVVAITRKTFRLSTHTYKHKHII